MGQTGDPHPEWPAVACKTLVWWHSSLHIVSRVRAEEATTEQNGITLSLRGYLLEQARKAGHLEEDGADKQDLHKFADRVHTVLKNPIDTSLLGKVRPFQPANQHLLRCAFYSFIVPYGHALAAKMF